MAVFKHEEESITSFFGKLKKRIITEIGVHSEVKSPSNVLNMKNYKIIFEIVKLC